jgi:hypothetical protein
MNTTALGKTTSPLQLRDELEAMILKELLGPGTEDEEIIESPDARWFVGHADKTTIGSVFHPLASCQFQDFRLRELGHHAKE